ncbi:hypothetical protein A3J56_01940 [Candidatus Giovannonibacteria bacterium RIFCSPHIGHO2_02_FULL_46_20]|uniref:Cytotoxic translational repressor of toxin-antitoxin stability system n=1 Tax=Candidatus Giovannonibacteria bacterium RIFCSPHIGHO2_02_FULL_46_20 TaxID=1798338 RepID=A0A1F5WEJ1_9BACT|nr:MAG: hypothetical protein A3J56_01940 [Candidatus Giovannonibacteria bacterium RIFCSPHIGHO2_02_FULL_46_20]
MDKITKFLNKLSSKEKETVIGIIVRVLAHDFSLLDVKKLKGEENMFRVRKGSVRIIFQKQEDKIFILSVERRNDTTY